jgi:hypothetical protein
VLLEAIVAATCIQGAGCQETTHAYYLQSKELQEWNKNIENYGNRVLKGHEWIVFLATPSYMMLSGQMATVKLSSNWYWEVNVKTQYSGVKWSW